MLITVQKQVEETLEIKPPCWYKTLTCYYFINEDGQLINVNDRMILIWQKDEAKFFSNEVESMLRNGTPCAKEEFETAYNKTIAKFQKAVGVENIKP